MVCNVTLIPKPNRTIPNVSIPPVPCNFLFISRPTSSGERVMIMANGSMKDKKGITLSRDSGDEWLVEVEGAGQAVFPAVLLCRCE